MPRKRPAQSPDDRRVARCVRLLMNPGVRESMRLHEVMRSQGFCKDDSVDPKKQMWIRRRVKKKLEEAKSIPKSVLTSPSTTDSSVTFGSAVTSNVSSDLASDDVIDTLSGEASSKAKVNASTKKAAPENVAPKRGKTRRNASEAQEKRKHAKKMREHAKAAHKFATRWYANERGKPDSLSAALISEK